ncbi:MAG TPA: EamA family transporter [Candidatus Deferrimicrobium sp.]|nr:EamA family transporter [Candidatus Deferrimicrobium sp.]
MPTEYTEYTEYTKNSKYAEGKSDTKAPKRYSTSLGILALIFWSTSIAFSRSVTEHMGTLNTAFFNLLFSGLLLLTIQGLIYKKEIFLKIKRLPPAYFYKVGIFMMFYMVVFYVAVGEASSRQAVIVVGIINYLWPGLTFLFSVPLLKHKAHYGLLTFGILIAFAGTAAAMLEGNRLAMADIRLTLTDNFLPYALALLAAVSWGLYSNLARKFKTDEDILSIPLIFIISGGAVLLLLLLQGRVPRLSLSGWEYAEFAYLVTFPTALAYLSWNRAMRDGNKNLVTAFSYLTPLASTLVSGLYLQVNIGPGFWVAAFMVLLGAVVCKIAVKDLKNLNGRALK